jgi:hypothetical protein
MAVIKAESVDYEYSLLVISSGERKGRVGRNN